MKRIAVALVLTFGLLALGGVFLSVPEWAVPQDEAHQKCAETGTCP